MVISHHFSPLLKYPHSLSIFSNLCYLVVDTVVVVEFFSNFISTSSLILYFKYQVLLVHSPILYLSQIFNFAILACSFLFCIYSISLSSCPFIFLCSPFLSFLFFLTFQILIFPYLSLVLLPHS